MVHATCIRINKHGSFVVAAKRDQFCAVNYTRCSEANLIHTRTTFNPCYGIYFVHRQLVNKIHILSSELLSFENFNTATNLPQILRF